MNLGKGKQPFAPMRDIAVLIHTYIQQRQILTLASTPALASRGAFSVAINCPAVGIYSIRSASSIQRSVEESMVAVSSPRRSDNFVTSL